MACEQEQTLYNNAHAASVTKQAEVTNLRAQLDAATVAQTTANNTFVTAQMNKQAADAVVTYLQGQLMTKMNELAQLLTAEQQAQTALNNCLGQQQAP